MSNPTNKKALELLFERPLEPVFTPRDDGKAIFELPSRFYSEEYADVKDDIQSRYSEDVDFKIPLRLPKQIPDLSFARPLGKRRQFSLFNRLHQSIAGRLIDIFMSAADEDEFIYTCAYCKDRVNLVLFQYCYSVAIQHRKDTSNFPVKPITETFPQNFVEPAIMKDARAQGELVPDQGNRRHIDIPRNYTASDREEEQRLGYFREDIGVNSHHWHWHLVYPGTGNMEVVKKDRRGELFYYMHHQILARYNVERFCNGLAKVKVLNNIREPLTEGYFPKILSAVNNRTYPSRLANTKLSDLNRDDTRLEIADIERWADRIVTAIDQGFVVDILSMIEEAAGTSMYETKREATTKLIEKKDAKVRETNTLLQEEVEPKLEKLRRERAVHIEFQKICRDIDYLTRIHVSFRWLKQNEALKTIQENIKRLTKRIEEAKQNIHDNNSKHEEISQQMSVLQKQIENESNSNLSEMSDELEKELKLEAKFSGKMKASQEEINQEENKLSVLLNNINEDENSLTKKRQEMSQRENLFQDLKDTEKRDLLAYEAAQKNFAAVSQGLTTTDDGSTVSLQDQLINANKNVSEAQTRIKTSDMELKHCKKLLQQKERETKSNDAVYNKDKKQFDNLSADIENITQRMNGIGYEEGGLEQLQENKRTIQNEIKKQQLLLERRNAYRYVLQYRDPEPGFDKSKVRGMVGKLFDVIDERYYLALTITAGGSIYSYVTDDDITSKKILQKGQLQHRVTIIPINKISSNAIKPSTVNFAKSLVGQDNVESALSLIQCDAYFDPVMKYVFGHTLICKDLNVAKQVTYHRNIHCRTVTLDGDVVDPNGTLSGGSKPKGGNILQELAEIKSIEKEIEKYRKNLIDIDNQLGSIETKATTYNKLKETLELRQHELKACKQRLEQTSFHQQQEEILSLKERIKSLEDELVKASEIQKTSQAKAKEIESKLTDAKGYRERELKAATETLKLAKIKADKSSDDWKKYEQQYETLQLEIETLTNDIKNSKSAIETLQQQIAKKKSDFDEICASNKSAAERIEQLKNKIKEQKDKINSQNKELKVFLTKCEKLKTNNEELTLEIKKKENEVNKVCSDNKDNLKKLENLENKYPWIKEEKEFFGIKNTRYDYTKEDPIEAGEKLKIMIQQKEKMERNINLKAMVLLEREEEQYHETMRRKKIVEQDKEKIEHIIIKMDEKKREKVEKAWKVVNDNFSSIFSSLLQGAEACLDPVKMNNQLMGLEIKVGFNGVWKESLGELSGGQRSLVALSLVLAMLKFSPAPLYILDEVDAALDMSHTQNIGNMLKVHFTSSQFIIVSLKDGMFNNANVLFRTKFEEGVSAVTRTVNAKASGRK